MPPPDANTKRWPRAKGSPSRRGSTASGPGLSQSRLPLTNNTLAVSSAPLPGSNNRRNGGLTATAALTRGSPSDPSQQPQLLQHPAEIALRIPQVLAALDQLHIRGTQTRHLQGGGGSPRMATIATASVSRPVQPAPTLLQRIKQARTSRASAAAHPRSVAADRPSTSPVAGPITA